jgi:hypothetical protein
MHLTCPTRCPFGIGMVRGFGFLLRLLCFYYSMRSQQRQRFRYSTVPLIHLAVIRPVPFAKIFDINGVGMI